MLRQRLHQSLLPLRPVQVCVRKAGAGWCKPIFPEQQNPGTVGRGGGDMNPRPFCGRFLIKMTPSWPSAWQNQTTARQPSFSFLSGDCNWRARHLFCLRFQAYQACANPLQMIVSNWTRVAEEEEDGGGGGGGSAVLQQAATLPDVVRWIRWSDYLNILSHQGSLRCCQKCVGWSSRFWTVLLFMSCGFAFYSGGIHDFLLPMCGSPAKMLFRRLTADTLVSDITRYPWIL